MPSAMKRNAAREARIADEIIVDAHNEIEQAMGWYYYLQDGLHFPFHARCIKKRPSSPLRAEETVTVLGMAPEEECEQEMFVRVQWNRRALAVPLAQLKPHRVDPDTRKAVEDWHYWIERGYRL